jgi:RNase H-fold protein (predicted Holliday junction resolvase)
MELRATRKRIGFALSDAFRSSLLETRTLTNSNNSEVVSLRAFLAGKQS